MTLDCAQFASVGQTLPWGLLVTDELNRPEQVCHRRSPEPLGNCTDNQPDRGNRSVPRLGAASDTESQISAEGPELHYLTGHMG